MSWTPPPIVVGQATDTVSAGGTVSVSLDPTPLSPVHKAALRWGTAGVIEGDAEQTQGRGLLRVVNDGA